LFAQDVLDWAEKKFPEFFAAMHYSLAERSPALRERLHETLSDRFTEGKASLTNLPEAPGRYPSETPAIIFANEFFDALPVEVLSSSGEVRISEKKGRFFETWTAASAQELGFLDRYSVHPEGKERIETPLIAQSYMAEAAGSIKRGFLIAIDYGYTRDELLAGRHRGTVTAYRQHSISANPYEAPGEQDITAHVNFTALAAAAEQQGMQVHPLLTQSQFLMGIGEQNQFADAFEECRLPQERAKVALQLKHLVSPAGMGETFHVLVGSKAISPDVVAHLSGLSFGKNRC
jgi:SAM-dependent MidA family methyltransferase